MICEALEKRNAALYAKLVPNYDHADTLEGETLRAINRVIYRFYNDGDVWFDGYGCETVGPAVTFLRLYAPIDLRSDIDASDGADNEEYEKALAIVLEKILAHVEAQTAYKPNTLDCLECKPKYEYFEHECGEAYDDDEDF